VMSRLLCATASRICKTTPLNVCCLKGHCMEEVCATHRLNSKLLENLTSKISSKK
jgi:hypothetical protein